MAEDELNSFGPEFDKYKPPVAETTQATPAPAPEAAPQPQIPAPQVTPGAPQPASNDFDSQFESFQKGTPAPTAAKPAQDFDDAYDQHLKGGFQPTMIQRLENHLDPLSNPQMDDYYARMNESQKQFIKTTSAGKIMDMFGQGFSEGSGGNEQLGMSDDFKKELSDAGVDLTKHVGLDDAFRTVIATPAARQIAALANIPLIAADSVMRVGGGVITGARNVANEIADTSQNPFVQAGATYASAAADYLMTGAPELMAGAHPDLPTPIAKAKINHVLDDEATYMGVKDQTPGQAASSRQVASEMAPEAEPVAQPTIHEAARAQAPETFQKYDALNTEQDRLRAQLQSEADVRDQAHEAEAPHPQEDIDALKDKLEGANKKNTKVYQARIDDMEAANEEHRSNAPTEDTPAMADIRQKIQDLDYQKRDLAPDVTDAYAKAREQYPEEPETTEEPETAPEAETPAGQPEEPQEEKAPTKPIEEQKAAIVADTKSKLIAAGRPADEAEAAAQLVAEHYQARAERFGGKRGTAEEMYHASSPEIKKGREVKAKARELAQPSRELEQKYKGRIKLSLGNAKSTITLMKTADASTFIHETGHAWFEELVSDAKHPDATPQMKADADALLKYAGAAEDGTIPTRGHEKVARSFERYLMEGVAPSKGLARVFAQFKNWLTKIYQTADRLKAPITNDIRDVFDRMLSNNPEKMTIAPDHEPGARLADIHEEEAMSTPPQDAAKARDAIEKEIDYTANLHDPEVKDALKAAEAAPASAAGTESTGQAPDVGATSSSTSEVGAAAGSGPAEVGANPESNPVATGSGSVGAEGGQLPADQVATDSADGGAGKPASGSTTGSPSGAADAGGRANGNADAAAERKRNLPTGEPTEGPNETYGNPESKLVDKAGNIRLDNLNTPEDVNQVLREIASENGDFMDARGVIPDAEVMALADAAGIKPSDLDIKALGETLGKGQLAAKIYGMRKLLIQSATEVRNFMSKAATGNDADVLAYAKAKARHIMIQKGLSAVTAEWGRAGRAFRALEGSNEAEAMTDFLQQATGRTLNQLKAEAQLGMNLDTPQKVSKFIVDSQKPSFGDMLLEYWVNGLISGPATHTTYMMGNTISAIWKAVPETAAASLIGKVHELVGGESGGVRLGEVGAQLKGAAKSVPNSLSAAGKALKSGVTTLLPGEEARGSMPLQPDSMFAEPGRIGNENISWKQLGNDMFSTMKGMRDAWTAAGDLSKPGVADAALIGLKRSPLGSIPDITVKGANVLPLGTAIRAPARAIAAIHSFFRTMNYSMDKAAIAYRTAFEEGLAGNDFAARVGDIVNNPTEEVMKDARGTATTMTLMGSGGEFTKAVSKLTNYQAQLPVLGNFKPLKFIDPFVHIGSNVIEQSIIQRTPLGILSSEMRKNLSGLNGPVARDFAQARMLVGTSLCITAGGLAAEGLVSGSGPDDPKQNAAWRMLGGNQPHSVKIGDMWYQTNRLGPLGMILGISADMSDVIGAMGHEDSVKVASMLVHAVTHNILDESFMRGPSDLIKAVTDSDRYGDAYIRNLVSSFVPFSVGMSQTAHAIDPYTRQTRSTMDAIKAKIPYVSETLFPKRDVWGEPIANKEVLGPAGFSAIYESKVNQDPTNQRLLALGVFPSQPTRKIRGVELTDQQYDDFSRMSGKMSKMNLDSVVTQPGFSQLPEAKQVDAIRKIITKSREDARKFVMMQNPDIINTATQNKLKPLDKKH